MKTSARDGHLIDVFFSNHAQYEASGGLYRMSLPQPLVQLCTAIWKALVKKRGEAGVCFKDAVVSLNTYVHIYCKGEECIKTQMYYLTKKIMQFTEDTTSSVH